jgi:hypothetical protein
MESEFYRVTFDDSAVNLKTRPMAVALESEQLTSITQIMTGYNEGGLELIAVEEVSLNPDFDMEDSRKWMANLDVTVIVSAKDATTLLQPFEALPDGLGGLKQLLDKGAPTLGMPKLNFSGEWVVTSIDIAKDFTEEPATPKM